jgi:hypothetical protein
VAGGFSGYGKIVFLQQRITFNDTGFGLLVLSGKKVHVVFLEKRLKFSVDKFSSFVCL